MSTAAWRHKPKGTASSLARWANRLGAIPEKSVIVLRAVVLPEPYTLHTWPVAVAGEAWGEEVLAIAQDDADARGEVTEYRVELLDAPESTRVLSTQPIRRTPRSDEDGGDPPSELIELVRVQTAHIEALTRSNVQITEIALRNQREAFNAALASVAAILGPLAQSAEQHAKSAATAEAQAKEAREQALAVAKQLAITEVESKTEEAEHAIRRTEQLEKIGAMVAMHFASEHPQFSNLIELLWPTKVPVSKARED